MRGRQSTGDRAVCEADLRSIVAVSGINGFGGGCLGRPNELGCDPVPGIDVKVADLPLVLYIPGSKGWAGALVDGF